MQCPTVDGGRSGSEINQAKPSVRLALMAFAQINEVILLVKVTTAVIEMIIIVIMVQADVVYLHRTH